MDEPPRRRRLWLFTVPGCGCSLAGIALLGLFLAYSTLGYHIWGSLGTRWEFSRNEGRYDRIAELIKKEGLKPTEEAYFAVPKKWDQKSISKVDLASDSRITSKDKFDGQWVHAYANEKGDVFITICTFDFGHVGSYGLLYSSAELTESRAVEAVMMCSSASRLKGGWWAYSRGD